MPETSYRQGEAQITKRLERMIEASQSVTTIESFDTLMLRLIDLARDVTEAEAASFLLYNSEQNLLEFATVKIEKRGKGIVIGESPDHFSRIIHTDAPASLVIRRLFDRSCFICDQTRCSGRRLVWISWPGLSALRQGGFVQSLKAVRPNP